MKRIIFIIIIFFPLIVFGATSANYQLNQEGTGFTEFDGSSSNYQFKAVIGDVASEVSASANYTIDQRRIWAVTASSPPPDDDDDDDSGGGGGGGGGGGLLANTGANFSGRAYPLSRVDLLKDGQIIASTVAGPDAQFFVSVAGINTGSHVFSIIGEDVDGLRSQSLPLPVTVSSGVTVAISGIFLAPTLSVDKSIVKRGDNIAIFGQTVPESKVTIGVASEEEIFRITDADEQGVFLYNFDTALLERGDHETRAKATSDTEISEFGKTISFEVGSRNVLNTNIQCPPRGDFNNDCRVNLVDLSIAGFWYKKNLSEALLAQERTILNGDGIINLIDLSIMGFYWTG